MLFGTEVFEIEILKSIQTFLGCGFMDFIMPKISMLGNGGFLWIVCGLLLIINKKHRKYGFLLLLGLLVGVILGNALFKNIFARPRPYQLLDGITLIIESPLDYSFPSGHTLSSFIAAFTLRHFNKKIGGWSVFVASLIAFSRLYLFVHYPTDILGGVLLSFLIYRFILYVSSQIAKRNS